MNPYLLLAVAEGCGPGLIPALLDPDSDPGSVLADPPALPPAAAARLRSARLSSTATRWVRHSEALGHVVLTPDEQTYPDRLRRSPLRPNVLFARGDVALLRDGTSASPSSAAGRTRRTATSRRATSPERLPAPGS